MSSELPDCVEIGPRIYFIELREPFAWGFEGLSYHIDHNEQTIYLNAGIPEAERAAVLGRACRRALRRSPHWRMIPLVGKIS